MPRILALSLVLILALAATQPALAGGAEERRVERMTLEFERLFRPVVGAIDARNLVYAEHGGGFRSLSYELPRPLRAASGSREGFFRTLAMGHMAAEPTNPAAVVTAVISDLETQYNVWFTLVNSTDEELIRKTSLKITGPEDFELEATEDEVPYGANKVHLVWFNPETPFAATGLYTGRVVVKGAGRVAYRFFAEPASTTTLER